MSFESLAGRLRPLAASLLAATVLCATLAPPASGQSAGSLGRDTAPAPVVPSIPEPPATPDPEPVVTPPAPEPTLAVFIGDSFTSPAKVGTPIDNWAEIVADRFCWSPTYLARGGSGYVTIPDRVRYVERIPEATAVGADVIVIQGSTNDTRPFTEGTLPGPVADTLAALVAANPQAQVVVVGPTRPVAINEARVQGLRNVMAGAAADAGLPFVDGSDPSWLGMPEHYVDNQHLSEAGHAEFGQLVGDELASIPVRSGCPA